MGDRLRLLFFTLFLLALWAGCLPAQERLGPKKFDLLSLEVQKVKRDVDELRRRVEELERSSQKEGPKAKAPAPPPKPVYYQYLPPPAFFPPPPPPIFCGPRG